MKGVAVRIGFILLIALLLVALPAGYSLWWLNRPMNLANPVVELSIEPGTPPKAVMQAWVRAGVQEPEWLLYGWVRLSGKFTGKDKQIRAGSYALATGSTPHELLELMVRGEQSLQALRIIEGWTFRQVRAALAQAPGLRNTLKDLPDSEVMKALGAEGLRPEGWFFPDTYLYSKGVSDTAVLRRAHRAMQRTLQKVWAEREPNLPLDSMEEALILASIIEKETGRAADREKVAGVFINRLRMGMPLQTDPTVIYGMGSAFDGNLRKRDLQADTPFNTYTRKGLPPTPIAMPGLASLRAAVKPEHFAALYFVARGDGSSVFSETLSDHNRAVNQYQRSAR